MKYAIISDVHANPQALESVLADAEGCGAGQVICAGDVVGYGHDPAGAIRILREREVPTVMGNHDRAVGNYVGTGYMIGCAQDGVARHRAELGEKDLAWLITASVYLSTVGSGSVQSWLPMATVGRSVR